MAVSWVWHELPTTAWEGMEYFPAVERLKGLDGMDWLAESAGADVAMAE